MSVSDELLLQVIRNGIYYYDRFGKVGSFNRPSVSENKITDTTYQHHSFEWSDLGVKFWLTEKEAQDKAQEYLNTFPKALSMNKLKKICKLTRDDDLFQVDEHLGVHKLNPDYVWFDKTKKALIIVFDYDYDDVVEELPISEYGITWALTEKELDKGDDTNG